MSEAWALVDGFGLDKLQRVSWPREELKPGEARIAVDAVSLNRRDVLLVDGVYAPRLRFPAIPCSDVAGHILEAAPGSSRKVGERVVAHMFPLWLGGRPTSEKLRSGLGGIGNQGTLRSEMVLPEAILRPIPAHLDAREASTLPCAALTAWSAVAKFGEVGPDSRVLIQGTGGVSLFALQFAKQRGAFVVATSSKADKMAKLTALGADVVLDYTDPAWIEAAKKHTDDGFDLIVEVAGGADLDGTLRLVRPGGMVAVIGVLSGARTQLTLPLVLMRQVTMQGVTCGSLADFDAMLAEIGQHALRPVVSDIFGFGDARAALAAMSGNKFFGKIVVAPSG